MASHYLGYNRGIRGTQDSDFTYGTSTGSTDMELRIDDGKSITREDIIRFLESCERFLTSSNPHITGTKFPVGF